jgi:tetratricopeptide (TPR) repeat protein
VKRTVLASAAVGAAVGITALLCRAPGVLYADAGELLTAVAKKGVAHPPGFPLYLLIGGLWSDLARALGARPASALNAFSAVCDGVASALLTAGAAALLARARLALDETARLLLAAAAGLLAGFGPTLFDFSLGIEVYAIHSIFLAGALAASIAAGGEENARTRVRLTVLTGLFAGGGLAIHHATMVVAMPGLAVLLWGDEPRAARVRRVLLFSAALVPGLAAYAVLPLRAHRWPLLNWGNPSNLYRFWVHISARDYQVNIESSIPTILRHADRFFEAYRAELTVAGLALALLGLALAFKRGRWAAIGLFVVALGDIAFAVRYEIAEDQAAYYVPTFLATALLAVLGVAALLEKRPSAARWGSPAALALAVLLSAVHVNERSRAKDARAPETAVNFLASLPPNAVALTPEWNAYSPVLASLDVEGQRPDLLVLDVLLCRRGWYLDSFMRRHPDRYREVKPELDAYRTKLAAWEEGRPYVADDLTRLYNAFTQRVVSAAWERGAPAAWVGTVMPEHLPTGAALIPAGIAYRILPSRADTAVYQRDAPVTFDAARRPGLPVDETYDLKIRTLYAGMLTQRALYEAAFSRRDDAYARLHLALEISPASPEALEANGDLLAAEGKLDEAIAYYARAVEAGGDPRRLAEKSRGAMAAKAPAGVGK